MLDQTDTNSTLYGTGHAPELRQYAEDLKTYTSADAAYEKTTVADHQNYLMALEGVIREANKSGLDLSQFGIEGLTNNLDPGSIDLKEATRIMWELM